MTKLVRTTCPYPSPPNPLSKQALNWGLFRELVRISYLPGFNETLFLRIGNHTVRDPETKISNTFSSFHFPANREHDPAKSKPIKIKQLVTWSFSTCPWHWSKAPSSPALQQSWRRSHRPRGWGTPTAYSRSAASVECTETFILVIVMDEPKKELGLQTCSRAVSQGNLLL